MLIDPHGGVDDLRAGVLRVLHDVSFADDPTRALRAARYAARLDMELDPGTERLLRLADLGTVSDDRVIAELARIAAEEQPSAALKLIAELGAARPGQRAEARRRPGAPLRLQRRVARVRQPRHGDPARGRAGRAPAAAAPAGRQARPPPRARLAGRGPGAGPRPRARGARDRPRRGGRPGSTTTSLACATSSSRSPATTWSRPASPKARRSAAASTPPWPRSSTARSRGTRRSCGSPSTPPKPGRADGTALA